MSNRSINMLQTQYINYGAVTYSEMEVYVSEHCVGSGVTQQEMEDYVDTALSGITCSGVTYIEMVDYVHSVCSGITVSGYVTYIEMVDYVASTCSGITVSGVSYEEMTVYVNTVVSGITISGTCDVTKAYVDQRLLDLCDHFHHDLIMTSGYLQNEIEFVAFGNSEFTPPSFDTTESWDWVWDGGFYTRPTDSGNC
jgi:hypothetical protein